MFMEKPTVTNIVETVNELTANSDEAVGIMIGEKNRPDVNELIAHLKSLQVEFFGGIFPGIIYDEKKYEQGAVLVKFPCLAKPFLIEGLDTAEIDLSIFDGMALQENGSKFTAMILVDGLTSNIALFLSEMFNRFGSGIHYLGGGAGSLSLQQQPCLFTREGFTQNAAIVVFTKLESSLGVRHGWKNLMGPIVATRTNKNVVSELNWKNAFEVYRETVENDSGQRFTNDNFFDIAKGYPFGMMKEGTECVVRDPLMVNQMGELVCVGEVPENTVLSILKGATPCLVNAAGQAAEDALGNGNGGIYQSFIVDCISRVIFLEGDFSKELVAVKEKINTIDDAQVPLGILSLGEISSYGDGYLEFFNKTIVVGILYGTN